MIEHDNVPGISGSDGVLDTAVLTPTFIMTDRHTDTACVSFAETGEAYTIAKDNPGRKDIVTLVRDCSPGRSLSVMLDRKAGILVDAYPICMPGDETPGRWLTDPQGRGRGRWSGQPRWAVRHGVALCHWSMGRTRRADNVLMPDGTRGPADDIYLMTEGAWRRPDGKGGWIHGRIEFSDLDAVFTDMEFPNRRKPRDDGGKPSMEADMAADAALLDAVEDDGFAQALYAAMCNREWRRRDSTARWNASWRAAGGIVADLRRRGEIYLDYYCSGMGGADAVNEGDLRDDVRAALDAIGWHALSENETLRDHAAATVRIAELETVPATSEPAWYPKPFNGMPRKRDPDLTTWSGRIHNLGITGRVSEEGWRELWEMIDLEMDRRPAGKRPSTLVSKVPLPSRPNDATGDRT